MHWKTLLKQIIPYVFVFLIIYVLTASEIQFYCKQQGKFDFDTQNLFVWEYQSFRGAQLFGDLHYYYGALLYNASAHPVFFFIYSLVVPLLYTAAFWVLKKLFGLGVGLFALLILFLMSFNTMGHTSFSRYGLLPIVSVTIAGHFYLYGRKNRWLVLLYGLAAGLIFSAFNGEGIMILLALSASFFLIILFTNRDKKFLDIIRKLLQTFLFFGIGFLIGALPLLIYLIGNGILDSFFVIFSGMTSYAKLPFRLDYWEQITLLVLVISSTTYLVYAFFKRKRFSKEEAFLIGILFATLVIEQKNMLRPIISLMVTYTLLLIFILFKILVNKLSIQRSKFAPLIYLSTLIILIPWFQQYKMSDSIHKIPDMISTHLTLSFPQFAKALLSQPSSLICNTKDFESYEAGIPDNLKSVTSELLAMEDEPFIYSFPYDPIFYFLFKQQSPPASTVYESSPRHIQERNIEFISTRGITHVIYKPGDARIDFAPDYLRGSRILLHILNNFTPIKQVGEYVIMERRQGVQNFESLQESFPQFYNHLTNVDLGFIPYSEGYYKKQELSTSEVVLKGQLSNEWTDIKNVDLKNSYLLLSGAFSPIERSVSFYADGERVGVIRFNTRVGGEHYIINLSRVPFIRLTGEKIDIMALDAENAEFTLLKADSETSLW